MNFSHQWRALWPIASIFASPNLISGASSQLGPLLFHPCSPPRFLLFDSSLSLQPPASNSSLLSALPRRHSPSSTILFFPSGDNSHSIAFISVSLGDPENPQISDLFFQTDGFKHRYHRITGISASPPPPSSDWDNPSPPGKLDSVTEGFLMATTLYSVNWFRVESRVTEFGAERVALVPVAKQGFGNSVVHACWNPHFRVECAVLMENGDLCWFDLNSRRGGKIKVVVDGEDPGEWLGCQYGGQPWILFVGCSKAVVLVDLRAENGVEPRVLARFDVESVGDPFLAFCKACFSDFHVSVVTERRLMLFDSRQPMVPVLMWEHSLDHPTYVSMFRLSELRQSEEYKWASESGFAILAGSFPKDQFGLFCYGPKERGAEQLGDSSIYAWELPSSLSLSGKQCGSIDQLLRQIFAKEKLTNGIESQEKKDGIAGFVMLAYDLFKPHSGDFGVGGFGLIRLMTSGKLEMQEYNASLDLPSDKSDGEKNHVSELCHLSLCCNNLEHKISTRYSFFKLRHLNDYMSGSLSITLVNHGFQSNCRDSSLLYINHGLKGVNSDVLTSPTTPVSVFISDASVPTSIFEIASRILLTGLGPEVSSLAFSKYSELFGSHRDAPFQLLEVPSCLPHNRLQPFFVGRPFSRSTKWSEKAPPVETLIGPVLPLPVLTVQSNSMKNNGTDFVKEEPADVLLTPKCKMVLDCVYPEVSIADIGSCDGWNASQEVQDDKTFFVHEPACSGDESCNRNNNTPLIEKEPPQMNDANHTCLVPSVSCRYEKFSTFVCGIADKLSLPDSHEEEFGLEMVDLSPVKLDVDSSTMLFQPDEQKIYKCLKRQFSKWQENYKPYQDFCTSSKIPRVTE